VLIWIQRWHSNIIDFQHVRVTSIIKYKFLENIFLIYSSNFKLVVEVDSKLIKLNLLNFFWGGVFIATLSIPSLFSVC